MRGFIGKILGYLGASHELHIKRNVVTYGICVTIATVLWFLNALNKEYTGNSLPDKIHGTSQGKTARFRAAQRNDPSDKGSRFRPIALQHQHLFFTDRTQCKFVAR